MDQGLAIVLSAGIAAAPILYGQWRIAHHVKAVDDHVVEVHEEVVTGNALKVGASVDAAETRRVEEIPHDERTVAEQHHLDTAPPPDPAQGPGR